MVGCGISTGALSQLTDPAEIGLVRPHGLATIGFAAESASTMETRPWALAFSHQSQRIS